MAITPFTLTGSNGVPNRLFAPLKFFRQDFYKTLTGGNLNDILYGGYGTVQLSGGAGPDTFIIGATPGGTGTTEYTYISDYDVNSGDRISLSGGLSASDVVAISDGLSYKDVLVKRLDVSDLAKLETPYDPNRVAATVSDTGIIDKATGQYLAILKNTDPDDVIFTDLTSLDLTATEEASLALPTGGQIAWKNLNPFAPGFAPRFIELADIGSQPADYLSSGVYTTLAGAGETFNKFAAFDFYDPLAPYGTFLNGRVGPVQHTHGNELELFFVVAGTYILTEGSQTGVNAGQLRDVVVGPGSFCYGPMGRIHGFRGVPGDGPGRILSIAIPAGLESFFHNAGTAVTNRFDQIKPNSAQENNNVAFWAGQRGDKPFLTPWDLGNAFAPTLPEAPLPWSTLREPYTGRSLDGNLIPTFSATWPGMVTSSISAEDRPRQTSKFGETRIAMVTPQEAAAVSGRVAWKGPFSLPFQAGANFEYDYLEFDATTNTDFSAADFVLPAGLSAPLDPTPSSFLVLYSLSGELSLKLYDQVDPNNPGQLTDLEFDLAPLTYVQIPCTMEPDPNNQGQFIAKPTKYSLANNGDSEAQALSIYMYNQEDPRPTTITTASPDNKPGDEVMTLSGSPTFAAVDFRLTAAPTRAFSRGRNIQIAVVSVDSENRIVCRCDDHGDSHDDDHGTALKTVAPDEADYLKEALANAKVIMSVINRRAGQPIDSTSTLTNFQTDRQLFLVVEGTTVADALAALKAGKAINGRVKIGDDAVSLSQSDDALNISFGFGSSKNLTLQATSQPVSDLTDLLEPGAFNWNYPQQNLGLLDLTYDLNSTSLANTNIDLLINNVSSPRTTSAFYRNSGGAASQRLGFYQVLDEKGTILDPITRQPIEPTKEKASDYLRAVNILAFTPAAGFSVDSRQAANFRTRLEGGHLYAPFLSIGVGRSQRTFVPFAAVNSDGLLHNVTTGTNAWAWEDGLSGANNRRFDDLSFSLDVFTPFMFQAAEIVRSQQAAG